MRESACAKTIARVQEIAENLSSYGENPRFLLHFAPLIGRLSKEKNFPPELSSAAEKIRSEFRLLQANKIEKRLVEILGMQNPYNELWALQQIWLDEPIDLAPLEQWIARLNQAASVPQNIWDVAFEGMALINAREIVRFMELSRELRFHDLAYRLQQKGLTLFSEEDPGFTQWRERSLMKGVVQGYEIEEKLGETAYRLKCGKVLLIGKHPASLRIKHGKWLMCWFDSRVEKGLGDPPLFHLLEGAEFSPEGFALVPFLEQRATDAPEVLEELVFDMLKHKYFVEGLSVERLFAHKEKLITTAHLEVVSYDLQKIVHFFSAALTFEQFWNFGLRSTLFKCPEYTVFYNVLVEVLWSRSKKRMQNTVPKESAWVWEKAKKLRAEAQKFLGEQKRAKNLFDHVWMNFCAQGCLGNFPSLD